MMIRISLVSIVNFIKSRRALFLFLLFLLGMVLFSLTDWEKGAREGVAERVEKKRKPRIGEVAAPVIPSLLPEEESPALSLWGIGKETWKNFPRQMTVFKISPPVAKPDPGHFWAKKLGLAGEGKEDGESKRLWTGKGKIFRFRYKKNSFEYVFYPTESLVGRERLSLEDLTQKAEKKISDWGLFGEINFSRSGIKFLKRVGMERGTVLRFERADEVAFFYNPTILGFPLLARSGGSIYPTKIHLDSYGRLVELRHHLLDFRFGEEKTYPLKSLKEVMEALERGEGRVVGIEGGGLDVPELKQITLSEVSLAYLLPQAQEDFLQPSFVFRGRKVSLGESVEVTIFLPAVSGEWLY